MVENVSLKNNTVYELSKALPNKLLNADGSITDFQGNIIVPANIVNAKVYENSKAIVNKFINVDGEIKTYEQISMDIFVPVDVLPEVGEENKIYLVPAENGTFDEYYWINNKWELLGNVTLDLSNYPTFDQMNAAINEAVYGALEDNY